MKRSTIWILTVVMAIALLGLLAMQIVYLEKMVGMRNSQFNETVKRSLYSVSTMLEQNETKFFLDQDLAEAEQMYSGISQNSFGFGFGESNPLLGKFGVNGIVGMEFIWSRFVLSLDARPGYGLAFSSKYEYRGGLVGEDVFEVDADRNLRHFFDFGASIGFHYCF